MATQIVSPAPSLARIAEDILQKEVVQPAKHSYGHTFAGRYVETELSLTEANELGVDLFGER